MRCDVFIYFIIAHVINVGSGPVHVVGVWEQQCMLCVCMHVCVFVSCVALVLVLKHFCCILLVEDDISYSSDEDDGDMANDTMGKYHVRFTPLIIIIVVYTESIDSKPVKDIEVKLKVI